MNIEVLKDVIRDERGNYYVAVKREGQELTLVNAFVEASYDTILSFDEAFQEKYRKYEGEYLGKIPMDALRHTVYAQMENGEGRYYPLEDVSKQYSLTFLDTMQYYRNPNR